MAENRDDYEYTNDYHGKPVGHGWEHIGLDPKSAINHYRRRKDGAKPLERDPRSGYIDHEAVPTLKVFYAVNFEGHYPVGTSAIFVAENEGDARNLLSVELGRLGLDPEEAWETHFTFKELDTTQPGAFILNDGDY